MKRLAGCKWALMGVLVLCACSREEDLPVPVGAGRTPPPTTFRRVVPTDDRPVREAAASPPAISGGTLLVSSDDKLAFVSDPDRDRVTIVDVPANRFLHEVTLQPGDEPGRLVQDASGRVHVALRRGGAVVSIDPNAGSVLGRYPVCGAPRGIAFDPGQQLLHVACAGGELVSLSPEDGAIARRVALGTDLRDVMVKNGNVLVSRFKSAELLQVDAEGRLMSARRPAPVGISIPEASGAELFDTLDPQTAWRSVLDENGNVLMLHQLARNGEIELPAHESRIASENGEGTGDANTASGSDNAKARAPSGGAAGFGAQEGSAYGGDGLGCSGVVQAEITRLDLATGQEISTRIPAVLAVDIAVSPYDGTIAVARAGVPDPQQPQVTFEVEEAGSQGGIMTGVGGSGALRAPSTSPGVMPVQLLNPGDAFAGATAEEPSPCTVDFDGVSEPMGQPVAVAFTRGGTLLVQSREPALLALFDANDREARAMVALGGASVYDTGHEIFHRDAGAGMACASCHAEGGDDGHVWVFSTLGARRTQALHVGLEGTAPFHWQGDMSDLGMLMEEVLVGRMGGVHQSPARAGALQRWLFELQPPAPVREASDPAAERGRALFEGQAECSTCHSGLKLTDNRTVDVGTGEPLQVPSLVGVAYRAPFIHNGCAASLRDRFDPGCGGAKHGQTAELDASQIDDLVAYLETL